MKRRIPLLVNPTAGAKQAQLQIQLCVRELELDLRLTTSAEQARKTADELVEAGHDRLLVAGGDGTLHQVVQSLATSRCALGVVPTGTGNDLARALGIPLDPLAAARLAVSGHPRSIDLGRVGKRWFATSVAVGIVGAVLDRIERRSAGFRGPWVYPYALLRSLRSYRPPRIRLCGGGSTFDDRAFLAVVANTPLFGGGMRIAPDVRPDDGRLQTVIVGNGSRLHLATTVLPRVYRGTHLDHIQVSHYSSQQAELACDPPSMLRAEGESLAICGADGIRVRLEPQALRVIAPDPR